MTSCDHAKLESGSTQIYNQAERVFFNPDRFKFEIN